MDLFDYKLPHEASNNVPLSERLRPQSLAEFVGQPHLVGPNGLLTSLLSKQLPSLLLWGPPGVGKTTLAKLLTKEKTFYFFSAVLAGLPDLRKTIERAKHQKKYDGKETLLFIDEIHRFNKAQQDYLLPYVEDGTVTFIGATTENPSFEIIGPLLSRCQVLVLNPLTTDDLKAIIKRAMAYLNLQDSSLVLSTDAEQSLIESTYGDARKLLNTLETAHNLLKTNEREITPAHIQQALQTKTLRYDKNAEEHYNTISAFIKSMRGSDSNASLYYLARMLEGGEDPHFILRRMVIFASEDVGNADPRALPLAVSALQAFDLVGLPEGWIPLAQVVAYLAVCPKSNASYQAYLSAKADVNQHGNLAIPKTILNAPTQLMKELGYHKGYLYPHDFAEGRKIQDYLPDKIKEQKYYQPKGHGFEKTILEWMGKKKL